MLKGQRIDKENKWKRLKVMRDWLQTEHNMFCQKKFTISSNKKSVNGLIVEDISLIIHRLSEMLTTQEDLLNELNISKEELIELNELIYNNDFSTTDSKEGLGRKYWNTMIPYIKNGVNEKVVNYESSISI